MIVMLVATSVVGVSSSQVGSKADFQARYNEFCTKLQHGDPSFLKMAVPSFNYYGPHGVHLDYTTWAGGFTSSCEQNHCDLAQAVVGSVTHGADGWIVAYRWHYRYRHPRSHVPVFETISSCVDTWAIVDGQMRMTKSRDLWIINRVNGVPVGAEGPAA